MRPASWMDVVFVYSVPSVYAISFFVSVCICRFQSYRLSAQVTENENHNPYSQSLTTILFLDAAKKEALVSGKAVVSGNQIVTNAICKMTLITRLVIKVIQFTDGCHSSILTRVLPLSTCH